MTREVLGVSFHDTGVLEHLYTRDAQIGWLIAGGCACVLRARCACVGGGWRERGGYVCAKSHGETARRREADCVLCLFARLPCHHSDDVYPSTKRLKKSCLDFFCPVVLGPKKSTSVLFVPIWVPVVLPGAFSKRVVPALWVCESGTSSNLLS